MSLLSIIIPTLNAGTKFGELLEALNTQTLRAEEILVIDSTSTNGTAELAKGRGCEVITINRQDFDHGTTRNLGVAQTDSEFVVFLTQDVIPADEHVIAELIKPMQTDSKIAICYGRWIR